MDKGHALSHSAARDLIRDAGLMERHGSVEQLMQAFAERTGLAGSGAPQRYLWTGAFAVCNFLALYRMRSNPEFLDLAPDGYLGDMPPGEPATGDSI